MIWGLIIWYFLAGPGAVSGAMVTSADVADLETRVEAVVADPDRRENATRILKELRKLLKRYEKTYASSGRQLNKIYRDHSENRAAALAILDDVNALWIEGQQRALDARFALRAQLTKDEWETLYGADSHD